MSCIVQPTMFAVVLGLVVVSPAHGAPVALAKPSEAVTVIASVQSPECVPGSGRLVDSRQNGDATTSAFTVPAKHVFVVTSVEFAYQNAPASRRVVGNLLVIGATAPPQEAFVTIVPSFSDANGQGGGTVTIPPGFPVKSGARLCFLTSPPTQDLSAIVHGFLAKDK